MTGYVGGVDGGAMVQIVGMKYNPERSFSGINSGLWLKSYIYLSSQ